MFPNLGVGGGEADVAAAPAVLDGVVDQNNGSCWMHWNSIAVQDEPHGIQR